MLLRSAMRYYRLWIYSCNGVLLLSVLVFTAVGGFVLTDLRMRFVPLPLYHPTLLYGYVALLLQAGVLQAVGCVSAVRLNERWLNVYWLLMLVLLVGDVLVGVVWVFLFSSLTSGLSTHLRLRLHADYGAPSSADATALWDRLQREHNCCGAHGPVDYNDTRWYATISQHVPELNDTRHPVDDANLIHTSSSKKDDDDDDEDDDESEDEMDQQQRQEHRHPAPPGPPPAPSPSTTPPPYRIIPYLQWPRRRPWPVPPTCCREHYTWTNGSSGRFYSTNDGSGKVCWVRGCAEPIRQWLQRSADLLFILGYCVIAFLKLCFLGILRYEIREMIQKIRLLQGELQALPDLATIGLPASPNHIPSIGDICGGGQHHQQQHHHHKPPANGNNNELEMKELTNHR